MRIEVGQALGLSLNLRIDNVSQASACPTKIAHNSRIRRHRTTTKRKVRAALLARHVDVHAVCTKTGPNRALGRLGPATLLSKGAGSVFSRPTLLAELFHDLANGRAVLA